MDNKIRVWEVPEHLIEKTKGKKSFNEGLKFNVERVSIKLKNRVPNRKKKPS